MEEDMKSTLTAALVLSAAASAARADVTLETVGGTLYATSIDGTRAVDHVRTADKNEVAIEVLSQNALPILSISHSRAGVVVHTGHGGSAPLTTVIFGYGEANASYNASVMRNPQTGVVTRPSAQRVVVLDVVDFTLIDAGQFVLNGAPRAWALVQRTGSGEAVLVDYDVAGGPIRRTLLGFIAPIGSNKGSVVATDDGHVHVVVANQVKVMFGDLLVSSWSLGAAPRTLTVGEGFRPESTRLGIIAILIGLFTKDAPVISFQRGDELVAVAVDGPGFRTVARQEIPPDAQGLMEPEGLFEYFYLLPYIEQENLYKGAVGHGATPILSVGH
jgi:hypothetical protein